MAEEKSNSQQVSGASVESSRGPYLNLEFLAQETFALEKESKGRAAEFQEVTRDVQSIGDARVENLNQQAADTSIVANAQAVSTLETQEQNFRAAESLGTLMSSDGELVTKLGESILENYQAGTQAAEQLQIMQNVPFLSGRWFANQFGGRLVDTQNKLAIAATKYNNAVGTLGNIQRATQESIETNSKLKKFTQAELDAQARINAKAAELKALEVQQANAALAMDAIQVTQQFRQQDVANYFRLQDQYFTEERMRMTRAEVEKNKDEAEFIHRNMVRGMKKLNAEDANPNMTPQDALILYRGSDPRWKRFVEAGTWDELYPGMGVVAATPAEAYRIVRETRSTGDNIPARIRSFLSEGWAEGVAASMDQKPDSITAEANAAMAKAAASQHKKIKSNDTANIYKAPSFEVLTKAKGVTELPLFNTVIAPMMAAGVKEPEPGQIISGALAQIKEGKLKYNDVVDGISYLFQAAVNTNNALENYRAYGIDRQRGYNAAVEIPGDNWGAETVDLTDKAKLGVYISREMRRRAVGGRFGSWNKYELEGVDY